MPQGSSAVRPTNGLYLYLLDSKWEYKRFLTDNVYSRFQCRLYSQNQNIRAPEKRVTEVKSENLKIKSSVQESGRSQNSNALRNSVISVGKRRHVSGKTLLPTIRYALHAICRI